MRIVAGRFKGRALSAKSADGIRPTSDRVRESVFNILSHGIDEFSIAGAKVVDLFAGTGALGIEAVSRGAGFVMFVDAGAPARAVLRRHVEEFGLGGMSRILKRDATDLGPCPSAGPFELAFLDPPYSKGLGENALKALSDGGWLKVNAVVVAEEICRHADPVA